MSELVAEAALVDGKKTYRFAPVSYQGLALDSATVIHHASGVLDWTVELVSASARTLRITELRLWNKRGAMIGASATSPEFRVPVVGQLCRWKTSVSSDPTLFSETTRITLVWTANPPVT